MTKSRKPSSSLGEEWHVYRFLAAAARQGASAFYSKVKVGDRAGRCRGFATRNRGSRCSAGAWSGRSASATHGRSLGGTVGADYYDDRSPDNTKEVAQGWIKEVDTIEELAGLAGFTDPATVVRTVEEYNQGCAAGHDAFGRPAGSLIPRSPAVLLHGAVPGGPNTCGGPRRDQHARILNPFGQPIRGCTARASSARRSGCCTRRTAATCRSRCASAASPPSTRWGVPGSALDGQPGEHVLDCG